MKADSPKRKLFKTLVFAAFLLAVIAAFVYVAAHPEPRPAIPDDADHRGVSDWQRCLDCHGKQGVAPLPPTHPLKEDLCFRCHEPQNPQETRP